MRTLGIAAACSVAWAVACTSVHPVHPLRFIPRHHPEVVSVWTAGRDSATFVEHPAIHGDTLTGFVFGQRWARPLEDIVKVEADARDPRRTALLVAGIVASAVGFAVLMNGPATVQARPECTGFEDIQC